MCRKEYGMKKIFEDPTMECVCIWSEDITVPHMEGGSAEDTFPEIIE